MVFAKNASSLEVKASFLLLAHIYIRNINMRIIHNYNYSAHGVRMCTHSHIIIYIIMPAGLLLYARGQLRKLLITATISLPRIRVRTQCPSHMTTNQIHSPSFRIVRI